MAADSVAVNQPAATPTTTMMIAPAAQMDWPSWWIRFLMLNLSPRG